MINWLLSTSIGRYVGIASASILLSGLLYAGCQIKACISERAETKARIAEKTAEIQRKDRDIERKINDLDNGALADFIRRGGVLPKN